jgi:hypothetical protein
MRGYDKRRPRFPAQLEGIGQKTHGLGAGGAANTSFQILHATGAHPGPLCQRLLAETGGEPKAAQERSERLGSGVSHGSGFGSPAPVTKHWSRVAAV